MTRKRERERREREREEREREREIKMKRERERLRDSVSWRRYEIYVKIIILDRSSLENKII